MFETVHVPLEGREYEVRIGPDLIVNASTHLAPLLARPRVAIVTEDHVAPLHLTALRAGLEANGIEVVSLVLPAGESTKAWPEFTRCVEWLLAQKIERRDIVIFKGRGTVVAVPDGGQIYIPPLVSETYAHARRLAPGWDVHVLEQEWRSWAVEAPKNADAAFLGFCKKRFESPSAL